MTGLAEKYISDWSRPVVRVVVQDDCLAARAVAWIWLKALDELDLRCVRI